MKELQVVKEQEVLGKQFRIYGTIEAPLFLARDVANWIEHTDLSRMVNLVDEDEKLKRTLYVSGQNREMWFLTEDGLYEVLMQSRKPIAKQFKKKVKEILKSLRLGEIELVNKTNNIQVDNQINDLMNMVNKLTDTVTRLAEQNNQLTEQNSILINHIVDANSINNDNNYNNKNIENELTTDDFIEEQLLNLTKDAMSFQDLCIHLNNFEILDKRIGVQIVYQLLRDFNILDRFNNPINNNDDRFCKVNYKNMLTKKGVLYVYRLIKDNFNFKYRVRR